LEFSYFDPVKKQFVTRTTEPIHLNVLEAAPGSSVPHPMSSGMSPAPVDTPATASPRHILRDLKAPSVAESQLGGLPLWRYIYILAFAAVALFIAWAGADMLRKVRAQVREMAGARAKAKLKDWDRLRADAGKASVMPWSELLQTYDRICGNVLDSIDHVYGIGARSLPRSEIKRLLVDERGLDPSHWEPIGRLLEFNEMIRFAGTASTSMETRARTELPTWVAMARSAVQQIEQLQ
jgi:hypothetical protein